MVINDLYNNNAPVLAAVQFVKEGVAEGNSRNSYENNYVILDPNDKVKAIKQNLEKARRFLLKLEKQFGPGYKIRPVDNMKSVNENMADDMVAAAQKKFPNAYISKNGQQVQKPENWGKPYTPPPQDAEKMQRDLTARYPNIDELVSQAEKSRDPDYNYAEGNAYYRGRDAEQNYQRLRQIQRVIQGLNEATATAPAVSNSANQTQQGAARFSLGRAYNSAQASSDPAQSYRALRQQRRLAATAPPKVTPDYSKGPTGYGKTTMSMSPMQTKIAAPVAPAVKEPVVKMPADNRTNKAKAGNPNIAAQTPYVQGRAGFGAHPTRFAKFKPDTSAMANLAQGMNNMFKQPSTVTPPMAQPAVQVAKTVPAAPAAKKEPIIIGGQKIMPNDPAYDKIMKNAPAMAESLSWSQDFDPGLSLYCKMKQQF
jgi:hypothetical protein